MKIVLQGIVGALFWAGGAVAQDLVYGDDGTEACLSQAEGTARLDCVGLSAAACMTDTPDGETTVGMGGCLDSEYRYWDGQLNKAYGKLMAMYEANDAEAKAGGWNAPEQVAPLKAMQRAWIAYRDARCDFERAKWGGGTGGGPATAECLMRTTAEQTLLLRDGLDGLQ